MIKTIIINTKYVFLFIMEKQMKKIRCSDKEDDEKHGFDNIPHEIIQDILSRLPITTLIQFSFVCRSWQMLANDPSLANLRHRAGNDDCYLIFHCDYPISNQLYFVKFSDHDNYGGTVRKICTPFSTLMPEFNVIGSCNGLLCLSNSLFNDSVCIYNPFTNKFKELPESLCFQDQLVLIGFGINSVTNEYKVVKIMYYPKPSNEPWKRRRLITRHTWDSEVQIYSFLDKTWRSLGSSPYQLETKLSESVLVSGRLHWVSRLGRHKGVRGRAIISFDLSDEQFCEIPKPDFGRERNYNYQLVALKGHLSAAVHWGPWSNNSLQIWTMKEYGNKDSWIKEYHIGLYSFQFLSQDLQKSNGIWRSVLGGRNVIVLGVMKKGNILVAYKGGNLVLCDPEAGTVRDLGFKETPKLYRAFVHFGSLNWCDS